MVAGARVRTTCRRRVSCRLQNFVGSLPGMPSVFQIRYGVPVAGSTKGCGSMTPFGWRSSQWSGPLRTSKNGPSGSDDVATEMQNRSELVLTRIP